MSRHVTVYVGQGCHLCDRALEVVEQVRAEVPFALEVVDITGRAELESAYRELLPVVEIDGVRAFHHFVPPAAFRARLVATGALDPTLPDGSLGGCESR